MHGLKGVASKPMLGRLRFKVGEEQLDFPSTYSLRQRHKYVRVPQVAIVLEDFILKNQMIPERVPGQV